MTGNDNRVSPKRYGLLKDQIQIADDFDTALEPAELVTPDMPDVDAIGPDDSSGLSLEDRIPFGSESLSRDLMKIGRRCAARPVEDARAPNEIIGYGEDGLTVSSTNLRDGANRKK